MFQVLYQEEVVKKDLPKISAYWKDAIKRSIETKLTSSPELYGKSLRRSLKNYRKLRVGDYRVIFRIEGQNVKIFVIGHRSVVYARADKRLR
jgi:mRNA interferase RelE/StbE